MSLVPYLSHNLPLVSPIGYYLFSDTKDFTTFILMCCWCMRVTILYLPEYETRIHHLRKSAEVHLIFSYMCSEHTHHTTKKTNHNIITYFSQSQKILELVSNIKNVIFFICGNVM